MPAHYIGEHVVISGTVEGGRRLNWVIRYRVEPTAGQAMCAVPRKRKFPEHYGCSRP
jgi:hypothetical protein